MSALARLSGDTIPREPDMFTPKFFDFFQALAKNNNRDWFNEHKADYQQHVVHPMCAFVDAMAPRLKKISEY